MINYHLKWMMAMMDQEGAEMGAHGVSQVWIEWTLSGTNGPN